jgi:hypothetical protein
MKAFEVTGIIDEQGNLSINQPVPAPAHSEVRVIVLYSEVDEVSEHDPDDDPTEEVKAGLHRAFQQAASGQRLPLSELWKEFEGS